MTAESNPLTEDRRVAISIKVSLATNLITVALAMIGAQGAIAIFVLDKREQLFWFYSAQVLAFLALLFSVGYGGRGVAKAYRDGFDGEWTLSDSGCFNRQAMLCVVGSAFVLFSSMLGSRRAENSVSSPGAANVELVEIRKSLNELRKQNEDLATELIRLKHAPGGNRLNARHPTKK